MIALWLLAGVLGGAQDEEPPVYSTWRKPVRARLQRRKTNTSFVALPVITGRPVIGRPTLEETLNPVLMDNDLLLMAA